MIRLELRKLLEEKTGALLLIAGGLLSVNLVLRTLPDFVEFSVSERLPGWTGFIFSTGMIGLTGLALSFVALVGLSHRLTAETPRLAVVGGALMALTPILYFVGLLTMLVQPLPELPNLLFFSPLPYVAGTALFGLAFLWKDGSIRFVGVPLLGFSGTWTLLYGIGLKNGDVPGWFPSGELFAVCLIAMGYLLYTDSATHEGTLVGS